MNPDITFHHVAAIRFGPVNWFDETPPTTPGGHDGCHAFASRRITLNDANGKGFTITIFAGTADALRFPGDA